MRKFFRRIQFFLNRRQWEADLAEEMAAHRAMAAAARPVSFGRDIVHREDAREVWGWMWMERFWQDLSYAIRSFRRSPGFTFGAVIVLALGIGANLAEFHVLDALLLHRLNIAGADSILHLYRNSKDFAARAFPFPAIEAFQKNCSRCSFVVAESIAWTGVVLEADPNARANFVSGNYFSALRILPGWGRLLNNRDVQHGAAAVAVLGYEYWRDHEGADSHIVGRILHVNGKPVEIVGVAPYDFDGLQPQRTAVWLPVTERPLLIAGTPPLGSLLAFNEDLFVRPKPGVSLASLEAELTALDRQLAERDPSQFKPGERVLGERLRGSGIVPQLLPPAIFLMFALVLLILLSACANLSNMLLARGVAREREIAIRLSLGASRGRIVRQLLTENLLLSALGAGAGLIVGYVSARLLLSAVGAPADLRITVDWQILAGAAMLALLSAVASGLPAALQISAAKNKSDRRRRVLVGVQVAISTLLLICSAVLTRNAIRSADIQLAFDYRNMIAVYPAFSREHLTPVLAEQKVETLIMRLRQLPGVDAITAAVMPPLGQRYSIVHLSGLPPVYTNHVAPNYFAAMKLPILRGRSFLPGETSAAIVSESAARAIWPNDDPIGKSWQFQSSRRTVVGIVKDSGANLVVDSQSVEAYLPIDPAQADFSAIVLHAKGDLAGLIRAIPAMSASMGEQVSIVPMVQSRENVLDALQKTITTVLSLGLIAAILAAAGMFAMVAFAVAQRTREIGIRIALGARPHDVLDSALDRMYLPVFTGMIAGAVLGVAVGRVVRSMVPIIDTPLDPSGFAAGLAAFLVIAFLATLSPALKALRIDPASTLRYE